MHATRIFMNGASQAVRLPAEYRFAKPEVCIARIGSMVVIYPKDEARGLLESAIGSVSEDSRRPAQGVSERDAAALDPTPDRVRARVYRKKSVDGRAKKSSAKKQTARRQRKST